MQVYVGMENIKLTSNDAYTIYCLGGPTNFFSRCVTTAQLDSKLTHAHDSHNSNHEI